MQRLANPPRRLTALERDVIAQAAARSVARQSEPLSFQLRPGLVAEMLRFYDHLRRQSQQVNRFEELIDQALGSDEVDRGAARMRAQTAFLAGTFREYERRVGESDGIDEHGLRDRLVSEAAVDPIRHVLVSVADWIGDPAGLYSADFDLLTRVAGLDTLEHRVHRGGAPHRVPRAIAHVVAGIGGGDRCRRRRRPDRRTRPSTDARHPARLGRRALVDGSRSRRGARRHRPADQGG